MKGYQFTLPVGFKTELRKARLAVGLRGGAWGYFVYPSEVEETSACAAAASEQFEDWGILFKTKEGEWLAHRPTP